MRTIRLIAATGLLLTACQPARVAQPVPVPLPARQPAPAPVPAPLMLPVASYREGRTFKVFGQEVHDRFSGFHTGDDVEVDNPAIEVPVVAIADGTVVLARRVSGYGGVLVIRHTIGSGPDAETVSALYGHLDLAQAPAVGAAVRQGQMIASLGDHASVETDGERKHLHFQLWPGGGVKLAGYVPTSAGLSAYLNPTTFFQTHGIAVPTATDP